MNDEDLIHALVRLDDAIKALENRLPDALRTASATDRATPDPGYAALETRHAVLRERTAAAVDRLSRLLDPAGGA